MLWTVCERDGPGVQQASIFLFEGMAVTLEKRSAGYIHTCV